MTEKNKAYFVTSKNFHGDEDYFQWLKEIKSRYQNIRSRVALQANYGALEFNWLLGRDIIQQKQNQNGVLALSINSASISKQPSPMYKDSRHETFIT